MKNIIWSENKKLLALTSTRLGGVSKKAFLGLNLALHVGDNPNDVQENRRLFMDNLKLSVDSAIFTYQSHSDIVAKVNRSDAGRGNSSFEDGIKADALYTYDANLPLCIYHADCVPIFIYVPKKHLVMIIHAGEPGTLKGIATKAINILKEKEDIKPADIYAHLGPSRQFMHYPVSQEKINDFVELGHLSGCKRINDQYYLDLPLINVTQLRTAGLPAKNISRSLLCTYENPDSFYSFAREPETGRMISLIMLKD